MKKSIDEFVNKHRNKLIVFVGSLNNFSSPLGIYNISADYKFVLDVPLYEIMRRYYLRICETEQKSTKIEADAYWKNLASGIYNIPGSKNFSKNYEKYMIWHEKYDYIAMTNENILKKLDKLI